MMLNSHLSVFYLLLFKKTGKGFPNVSKNEPPSLLCHQRALPFQLSNMVPHKSSIIMCAYICISLTFEMWRPHRVKIFQKFHHQRHHLKKLQGHDALATHLAEALISNAHGLQRRRLLPLIGELLIGFALCTRIGNDGSSIFIKNKHKNEQRSSNSSNRNNNNTGSGNRLGHFGGN